MDSEPDGVTYTVPAWTHTAEGWAGRLPQYVIFEFYTEQDDRVIVRVNLQKQ